MKFTIRAEKCPNRRGVEEVLKHFQGEVLYFDRVIEQAGRLGRCRRFMSPVAIRQRLGEWLPAPVVASLKKVPLLIVQDLSAGAFAAAAKYVLPAASFAEKDGCFVNFANLAQAIDYWARAAERARTDAR